MGSVQIRKVYVGLAILAGLLIAYNLLSTPILKNANRSVSVINIGSRYHLKQCEFVGGDALSVSIGEAVDMGLSPCPICKPTSLVGYALKLKRDFRNVLMYTALLTICIVTIPFSVRKLVVRRKAMRIAACKAGIYWEYLSDEERNRRISQSDSQLRSPPNSQPPSDETISYS